MPNFSLFARLFVVILLVAATFATDPAQAQPWSGIIDPSRAIDWSGAGVPGGIPTNRTQCGSTIPPTNNASVIQNALDACGANQYVKLAAGTFNLTTGVNVTVNNTTLRGSGPDQTILQWSNGSGCIGWWGLLGLGACANMEWLAITDEVNDGVSWTTPWTAGYAKGTTRLTVGSTANMAAGRLIWLDQLEETTDDGGVVNSSYIPTFALQNSNNARNDTADGGLYRTQIQIVRIVSVDDATHITITPGLEMPTWRSSQRPAVSGWGRTDNSSAFGIGLEDLTVENQIPTGDHATIIVGDCYGCWIKNIRSINAKRSHVALKQSAHVEIRDSYFYGSMGSSSQSYGIETYSTSDDLIINNIIQSTTAAYVGPCQGCVHAYNYDWGGFYTDGNGCIDQGGRNSNCVHQGFFIAHVSSGGMRLVEGNQSSGLVQDNFHGNDSLTTMFRNAFAGNDDQGSKNSYQRAIELDATSRANNVVGNVLGDSSVPGLTVNYEFNPTTGFPPGGTIPLIYMLGWAGQVPSNDPVVVSSLLRWGNYDTVHGSTQWNSAEVPTSGIPRINGNPVPATHNLPNSFFLSAQPSFWTTPWGTPQWPAIGPDVTGGTGTVGPNRSNPGGHVYDIPAKLCFTHLSDDPAYPSSSPRVKLFKATNCYSSGSSTTSTASPIVTLTIQ